MGSIFRDFYDLMALLGEIDLYADPTAKNYFWSFQMLKIHIGAVLDRIVLIQLVPLRSSYVNSIT